MFTDPLVVTELLRRYYREEGYLSAEIDKPEYAYEGNIARAAKELGLSRKGLYLKMDRLNFND